MTRDEAVIKRQEFREEVYQNADEDRQHLLSEHDKIAMLTDLKYTDKLRQWRAPNPDLAPFLKEWREWQT